MSLVSKAGQEHVQRRIAEVEKTTAGELVVVIAERSDSYVAVRAFWSAGVTVLLAVTVHLGASELPVLWLLCSQPLVGLLLWWLLGAAPSLRLLVPGVLIDEAVLSRCKQLFIDQGLSETRDRSGVLLYLSEAEHRVQVMADRGIHQHLGVEGWQRTVDALVKDIRAGQAEAGLLAAIDAIGKSLAEHFPPRPDDENELPNEVVRV